MNVISAMTAGIAIVLMCIEIVLSSLDYSRCYSRNYGRGYSHDYSDPNEICLNVKVLNVQCSIQLVCYVSCVQK